MGRFVVAATAAALMIAGPAFAQGSASTGQAVPDSNMATPSGNRGGANNGIGHEGSLTAHNGSHSSTVEGAAAAAQIPISPQPPTDPGNPKVENEPALGGGQQAPQQGGAQKP
jgi:hypothetical protein